MKWGAVSLEAVGEFMSGAIDRVGEVERIPLMPAAYPSPALQMLWCDRNGRFPGESGFPEGLQTVLDRHISSETPN